MDSSFLSDWYQAAHTTVGLFWTAFWAFAFGYAVSSMIQVFVTRARMQRAMGTSGPRSVGLGTVFGFLSSSCSFAALSTTRALFVKGAGLVPSLAFLLASTNLVIELGIVIAVFLSWQFVVGEYVGGLLLILLMWPLVRATAWRELVEGAREHARGVQAEESMPEPEDPWALARSAEGWRRVGRKYLMEWGMVWKDVTVGFTVAGVIAVFVPRAFFETLFAGAGAQDPTFGQVLLQALVGPVAAFFTFIGSMGNIPLAAVLFGHGVSFAGVIAFIFSDLVVFPVLRIQASYYGWRMALYITGVFLAILVAASLILHYGFAFVGWLPEPSSGSRVSEREFFELDHSSVLGAVFLAATLALVLWSRRRSGGGEQAGDTQADAGSGPEADDGGADDTDDGGEDSTGGSPAASERVLLVLALAAYLWLAGGLALRLLGVEPPGG